MGKFINRRTALKQIGLVAGTCALPVIMRPSRVFATTAGSQPLPTEIEAAAIADIARKLMDQYHAPGLSVAIARHGQFVYRQGFGLAEKDSGEQVSSCIKAWMGPCFV
jgi:CubicO group peptidase (beta-lactamase class C family)